MEYFIAIDQIINGIGIGIGYLVGIYTWNIVRKGLWIGILIY